MAFHWVKMRVIVHATESKDKVESALQIASGPHAEISVTNIEGHYGNPIVIIEAQIRNRKAIDSLFKRILDAGIINCVNSSDLIDEDCIIHLRLCKQSAYLRKLKSASHGDVITISAKIVAHPAKRTIAADNLRRYISELV